MKCTIFFVATICLCCGSFLAADGQARKKQPQRKTSQSQKPSAEEDKPQTSTAAPSQQQKPSQEPATTPEPWQSSYAKFVQEIAAYSGPKPAGTIYGLAEGQAVPDSWDVMKSYGKRINWEGVFNGTGPSSGRHENQSVMIKMNMEGLSKGVLYFMYASSSSADKWAQVVPGTRVSFRGKVAGVMFNSFYLPSRGEIMTYVVTVYDAEVIDEAKKQ